MRSLRKPARCAALAALVGAAGLAAASCSAFSTSTTTATGHAAPRRTVPGPVAFVAEANILAVSPQGGRERPVTRGRPPVVDAAWSRNGRELVFARRSKRQVDVFVARGGGRPHLIRRCSLACNPHAFAWSPDGRRIAFVTDIDSHFTGTAGEIAIMNADGTGFRAVCTEGRCGQGLADPQWSPDGSRLLFSNMDVIAFFGFGVLPSRIWVARPDGSGAHQLTQPHCRPGHPPLRGCFYDSSARWSPDGHWIAFSRLLQARGPGRHRQPRTTIELMHPDGSDVHTIAACTGDLCNQIMTPTWSPDGSRLAYIPRIERSANAIVATPAGHLTVVRACAGRHCITPNGLAWSPDGSELALLSATKHPGAFVITTAGHDLHAVGHDVQCCLTWLPSPGS